MNNNVHHLITASGGFI